MANVLTDKKLVSVDLLTGKYTTDLKAWVQAQIGAEGLRTVKIDADTHKMEFYVEAEADITEETSPAFSLDYSAVAASGAAADVSIADAGSIITATTVEGALAEIKGLVDTLNGADTINGSVAKSIKTAIGNLKNEDEAVDHQFVTEVAEADGVVTVSRAALVADDIPDLTLEKITDAGTVASEDLNTTALADADSETATLNENIPTAAQVVKYVKDKTAAISGVLHFRGIVESTADITDPAQGDVVIIKDTTKEYIYDGINWQEMGDESAFVLKTTTIAGIDLQDDITAEEMRTALDVEEGSQENVIEKIKVGDAEQAVADKTVTLGTMAGETATDYVDFDSIVLAQESDIADLFPTA